MKSTKLLPGHLYCPFDLICLGHIGLDKKTRAAFISDLVGGLLLDLINIYDYHFRALRRKLECDCAANRGAAILVAKRGTCYYSNFVLHLHVFSPSTLSGLTAGLRRSGGAGKTRLYYRAIAENALHPLSGAAAVAWSQCSAAFILLLPLMPALTQSRCKV